MKQPSSRWVTFQGGEVTSGNGGMATLGLASAPMLVRYLRIWMTAIVEHLRRPRLCR